MNQYEQLNAGHAVDGYFIPRAGETKESAFNRAKAETLANMRKSLANVEALTLSQFTASGFQKHFK